MKFPEIRAIDLMDFDTAEENRKGTSLKETEGKVESDFFKPLLFLVRSARIRDENR